MADEKTNEEVLAAVAELRKEVEQKGFIDTGKIETLNAILDSHEEKAQQLTLLEQGAKNHEQAIAELKTAQTEYKEADEKRQVELKEQITDLEAEVARGIDAKVAADPEAYKESAEYKALNLYCKEGERSLYQNEEHKVLLRTDSGVDGGFLVPTELDNVITKKIVEIDPIRSIARVRTIASKSMEMAVRNTIPTATYEGEAETGADSASTYNSETVTPYRQTHTTPITRDMLMDAGFDMESEIASDSGEAFAFGEGAGFVLGSGFKEPAGFMANAVVLAAFRQGVGTSALVFEDDILKLTGDLKVGYNPVFVMNRRTLASIRTRKSSAGGYLWTPALDGGVASMLAGFPYVLANTMADEAANSFSVAFGDFRRGYTIVDRTGMSVVRDEVTQKKKAIVEFTMNRWNTGLVTLPEAIKVLKTKA
jgi:HK97 family phage major capsid protein